jgi:hypothetical protein
MKYLFSIIFIFLLIQAIDAQTKAEQQNMEATHSAKRIIFSSKDSTWLANFNQVVAQHLNSKDLTDTLFITFKEGDYTLNNSLRFKQKNTLKTAPIIINGDKNVVFSGGITLNNLNFKPISDPILMDRIIDKGAVNKILVYDLIQGTIKDLGKLNCIGFGRIAGLAPTQLFFDGQRMTLARYPNDIDRSLLKRRTSVIPINKIINAGLQPVDLPLEEKEKKGQDQKGEFEYKDTHVTKWLGANDIWLDGIFSRDWAWSLNKVYKIDTAKHTISLTFNEKYDLTNKNAFFFASNLLEEIDQPGEYYIDRENAKLYFYPPIDFNKKTSTVQLSQNTKDLVEIDGCSNVKFKNISFELGRYRAVNIIRSNNITFENCSFKNFGIAAITIKGENNTIRNCNIHAIGGTAISLDGGNVDSLISANNQVINCKIYDWAYYNRVYTPAIALAGVGNKVLNSELYDAPHGAITISGNNHLIKNNEIHDVLQEFIDFGAIYAFLGKSQLMRGHVISGNYFHDLGQISEKVHAIYADEGTAGWTIEDNVFYKIGNTGSRVAAVLGNTSSYLNVKNNLFLDCAETLELSFHFSTWGKKRYQDYFMKNWKIQYPNEGSISSIYLKQYPELKTFMTEERVYVNTNSFTDNVIGNFSIPLAHKNYFRTQSDLEDAEAERLIISKNNQITKDIALPNFLNQWKNGVDKNILKKNIPKLLAQYGFFKN